MPWLAWPIINGGDQRMSRILLSSPTHLCKLCCAGFASKSQHLKKILNFDRLLVDWRPPWWKMIGNTCLFDQIRLASLGSCLLDHPTQFLPTPLSAFTYPPPSPFLHPAFLAYTYPCRSPLWHLGARWAAARGASWKRPRASRHRKTCILFGVGAVGHPVGVRKLPQSAMLQPLGPSGVVLGLIFIFHFCVGNSRTVSSPTSDDLHSLMLRGGASGGGGFFGLEVTLRQICIQARRWVPNGSTWSGWPAYTGRLELGFVSEY